jgi:hypothetical protein
MKLVSAFIMIVTLLISFTHVVFSADKGRTLIISDPSYIKSGFMYYHDCIDTMMFHVVYALQNDTTVIQK